jgi:glyoxylase-like metal-dependent hydrolase (beta-lactamase superfamily II)
MNKVVNFNDKIFFYNRRVPSSNTTLIKGNVNILIDPGYNPIMKTKALKPLLKEAGISVKDIDEIWFSHSHPDHIGLTYYLLQEKDIKVICHPLAKDLIQIEPPIRGILETEKFDNSILKKLYPTEERKRKRLEALARFIVKFYALFFSFGNHAIKADECFTHGENRHGIKVIFLPGHTFDEVGFLLGSTLIAGDLIATFSFRRPAVLNVPSSDIDDAISSLEKIIEISPSLILPGHGNYSKIDIKLIKEIYNQTINLREKGILLLKKTHSSIDYALGLQKILPLFTLRIQERLALLYIVYKSYVKTIDSSNQLNR